MSEGRILVVDDESQIRRVMRAILIPQGFDVDDAKSGDEALDRLRSAKYDLVLLDIDMPGMTGFETCRAIRAVSDMPIFMLTGRSEKKIRWRRLMRGPTITSRSPLVSPLLARVGAALTRVHWLSFNTHTSPVMKIRSAMEEDYDAAA